MQSGAGCRKRKEERGGGEGAGGKGRRSTGRAQLTYQGHPQASEMSRNSCRPTFVIAAAVDGGGSGPVHVDYRGDEGKMSDQVSTCFPLLPPLFTRTDMHRY